MRSKKISLSFTALLFIFIHHAVSKPALFSDQDCLECHGKPNLSQILSDGTTRSLYVNPEQWAQDVHCLRQMTCVGCHVHANPYVHFREGYLDVNCETCHRAETEEYQRNVHFEYSPLSSDRELPRCYQCHTKHYVLRHDNPQASVHEKNLADTCGTCHAEVMVRRLLNGSSLGKISGHRKGDISERFDMKVCIHCHDPAHSSTGIAKDFCARCHDAKKKANIIIGPTHLRSTKWIRLNYLGGGLAIFLVLGTFAFVGYRSRKGILTKCQIWLQSMEKEEQALTEPGVPDSPQKPLPQTETAGSEEPVKSNETFDHDQKQSPQEEESE